MKNNRLALLAFLSLIFSTLLFRCNDAEASGWEKLAHFNSMINSVTFVDDQFGLVGMGSLPGGRTSAAQIFRTTDGGRQWTPASVPNVGDGCITQIRMTDDMNGLASFFPEDGPYHNSTWRTQDGGLTWLQIGILGYGTNVYQTPSAIIVTDLFRQGKLSTDGGASFLSTVPRALTGLDFVDDLHGVATNYRDSKWQRTTDGGRTWLPNSIDLEAWSVYAVKGSSKFYAAPETSRKLLCSNDFGENWSELGTIPYSTTGCLLGLSDDILYAQTCDNASQYRGLIRSTDKGNTWEAIGGPAAQPDSRFCVIGAPCNGNIYVYAFNMDGDLYRYTYPASAYYGSYAVQSDGVVGADALGSITLPIVAVLPHHSGIDTLPVTGAKFTLSYNSDMLDIPSTKLKYCVHPPRLWSFASATITSKSIVVELTAPVGCQILDSLSLGSITLNVYPGGDKSAMIFLSDLTLTSSIGERGFCEAAEGSFLANIVLKQSGVGPTASPISEFTLSPNPVTSGRVTLGFSTDREARVDLTLTDLLGREVYRSGISGWSVLPGRHQQEIPLQGVSEGSYIIRLSANGVVSTKRLIVLR
jgi:photosystem II stability/assembly factor-like uncharacterized protein